MFPRYPLVVVFRAGGSSQVLSMGVAVVGEASGGSVANMVTVNVVSTRKCVDVTEPRCILEFTECVVRYL